jgi:hypothetical protein
MSKLRLITETIRPVHQHHGRTMIVAVSDQHGPRTRRLRVPMANRCCTAASCHHTSRLAYPCSALAGERSLILPHLRFPASCHASRSSHPAISSPLHKTQHTWRLHASDPDASSLRHPTRPKSRCCSSVSLTSAALHPRPAALFTLRRVAHSSLAQPALPAYAVLPPSLALVPRGSG